MRRRRRWVSSWDLSHAPLTFFLSPFSALSARPLPPPRRWQKAGGGEGRVACLVEEATYQIVIFKAAAPERFTLIVLPNPKLLSVCV